MPLVTEHLSYGQTSVGMTPSVSVCVAMHHLSIVIDCNRLAVNSNGNNAMLIP
jgi:hypothetical protein